MRSPKFIVLVVVLAALVGLLVWRFVLRRGFIGEFDVKPGSWQTETQSSPTDCQHHSGLRTYDEWRQQVTLPYVAPQKKLEQIKSNYDRVGVGSSPKGIIEAFGDPDFEQEMFPKEANRPCTGYKWSYYFEKPTELVNEIADKQVSVYLTPAGHVGWIVGNVGLPEKGSPAPR
jgi:hypothetical protein